ncbi:hypothetical protein Q9R20_06310 [Microbacterium sp. PRF11]|nr:hypothetical protein [Microbacterium sp. PRF11]MDT0116600.1 hypothetical protein [Microbacterium sp. PRF11]
MGYLLSLQALDQRDGQQSQIFASTVSNFQCISNISVQFCK